VEAHIAFPTGLVAWAPARLGGGRLILFCHGSDVTRLPWTSLRRAALARRLFRSADLVVANSAFTARIAEACLGPFRRPVLVASPGVVVPGDAPGGETRPPDQVLFVGRLVPGKGLDVLLPAMDRLSAGGRAARLTIVGDGPLRSELERETARSSDRVRFLGAIAHDEVVELLRSASVVVVPSTTTEGLGLVALEAMAHGALVVATDVGGLTETMRDGENGSVVIPGDIDALAAAIDRSLAISATSEGERRRAAGRSTAAGHERATAIETSLAGYRQLLG
jgi:glycosyltransferase involved in cell wall biosynthesis